MHVEDPAGEGPEHGRTEDQPEAGQSDDLDLGQRQAVGEGPVPVGAIREVAQPDQVGLDASRAGALERRRAAPVRDDQDDPGAQLAAPLGVDQRLQVAAAPRGEHG